MSLLTKNPYIFHKYPNSANRKKKKRPSKYSRFTSNAEHLGITSVKNYNAPTRAKVDIFVMRSELQMVILTSGRASRRPRSSILNSLLAITASTVLLSCVQDLKTWQNISNSICSARFLKWQGIPHVGHGVPGVVVRLHFIHVLGEVTNGLMAAASRACIC